MSEDIERAFLLEKVNAMAEIGELSTESAEAMRALLTAQPQAITDDMVNAASSVIVGFSGEYGEYNEYLSEEAAREVLEAALSVAPQASAAQSAPAGEREAFEAYSQSIGYTLKVGDSGRYIGGYGAELWSGFKAGAAWQRAQSAPVVPEGELPWTGEQLARAWYLAEYGPGHDLAPGYAVAFARELAALLAAAPQPAAQDQGEVQRLREALEEIRRADMNAPVSESNAGCIKRIKQIAERALSASAEGKA